MKRVNWPFAAIVLLALSGVVARLLLWDVFDVPRLVRHHWADFCTAALFTAVWSGGINLLTPPRWRREHAAAVRWLHLGLVGLAVLYGLNIEAEDYFGEAEDGFDPGILITEWFGVPNTDTFDWWDVVAIVLGGLPVLYLQLLSTRLVRSWRRISLLLEG